MRSVVKASVFLLLSGVCGLQAPSAGAGDPNDDLQTISACAAYAYIQTGKYPETVDVYRKRMKPANAEVAKRARTGAIWTNRGDVLHSEYARVYASAFGKQPTRGQVSGAVSEWVGMLRGATGARQEAVHSDCRPIYEAIDRHCASAGSNCLVKL